MNRLSLVASAIALLLVGALAGALTVWECFDAGAQAGKLEAEALSALIKISEAKIKSVACEVNGESVSTDGAKRKNELTVGDFIANYVTWSVHRKLSDGPSVSCSGTEPKDCRLSFGGGGGAERWGRHIEFRYSPHSKTVHRESLRCLDVP